MREISSTYTVQLMVLRDQEGVLEAEHFHTPSILLCPCCGTRVDLVNVFWIIDMDFIGTDANDWAYILPTLRKRLDYIPVSWHLPYSSCSFAIFQVYWPILMTS